MKIAEGVRVNKILVEDAETVRGSAESCTVMGYDGDTYKCSNYSLLGLPFVQTFERTNERVEVGVKLCVVPQSLSAAFDHHRDVVVKDNHPNTVFDNTINATGSLKGKCSHSLPYLPAQAS